MIRPLPDPHEAARILDVSPTAASEEVRAAYLRLVKEHPPDRDPVGFEKLRDAYEALRDPARQAALLLMAGDPDAPLTSLLDGEPRVRRFVGPEPWLRALRIR